MLFYITKAILLSSLFLNFGDAQPFNKNGGFKIAVQKYASPYRNGTQETVSYLAKQKQTSYHHGSGKFVKTKTKGFSSKTHFSIFRLLW